MADKRHIINEAEVLHPIAHVLLLHQLLLYVLLQVRIGTRKPGIFHLLLRHPLGTLTMRPFTTVVNVFRKLHHLRLTHNAN